MFSGFLRCDDGKGGSENFEKPSGKTEAEELVVGGTDSQDWGSCKYLLLNVFVLVWW